MAPSLLEIAPELRNMIWGFAVHEADPIPITHFEPHMGTLHTEVDLRDAPPTDKRTAFHFTQSNQQINNEAAAMYYRSNTFRYVVADRGYVRLRAWVDMIGRLPRVRGKPANNGPHLEIELLGWVHSYNPTAVPRIRRTKSFRNLCFALARAGLVQGKVKITIAGNGWRLNQKRMEVETVRKEAEKIRKEAWEKKLEAMIELQEKEKEASDKSNEAFLKSHEEFMEKSQQMNAVKEKLEIMEPRAMQASLQCNKPNDEEDHEAQVDSLRRGEQWPVNGEEIDDTDCSDGMRHGEEKLKWTLDSGFSLASVAIQNGIEY
ncbi:uncharacterized protein MYCGRDRAFT_88778 [Zymoseptoria tritici IPO323]|uniref:Uncharacterized protein n=1 Tax=Zymoseptoria tritici (strain CBS 115943 / IPO323) TaxID=336722 RepID=F9WYU0_ZYMTI|nr:uncharacterized protein MYCGRDRAFT_88778 [Zymoseptoria tritici IPO323]EGP90908.1 hypothetical protein MYCGRDRAFT_88778 [Zymoseptoria tritici IPO323]